MPYKKIKVPFTRLVDGKEREELRNYLQYKTEKAIYQAPDTEAGKASLDRRGAA